MSFMLFASSHHTAILMLWLKPILISNGNPLALTLFSIGNTVGTPQMLATSFEVNANVLELAAKQRTLPRFRCEIHFQTLCRGVKRQDKSKFNFNIVGNYLYYYFGIFWFYIFLKKEQLKTFFYSFFAMYFQNSIKKLKTFFFFFAIYFLINSF